MPWISLLLKIYSSGWGVVFTALPFSGCPISVRQYNLNVRHIYGSQAHRILTNNSSATWRAATVLPGQEPPLQRDGIIHYPERLWTKYLIRETASWKADNSWRKGKMPFVDEKVVGIRTNWFRTEWVWLSFPITQGHISSRTGTHELPASRCSSLVILTIRVLIELVEMTACSINCMLVSSIWMRIDWYKWLINIDKAIWV